MKNTRIYICNNIVLMIPWIFHQSCMSGLRAFDKLCMLLLVILSSQNVYPIYAMWITFQ